MKRGGGRGKNYITYLHQGSEQIRSCLLLFPHPLWQHSHTHCSWCRSAGLPGLQNQLDWGAKAQQTSHTPIHTCMYILHTYPSYNNNSIIIKDIQESNTFALFSNFFRLLHFTPSRIYTVYIYIPGRRLAQFLSLQIINTGVSDGVIGQDSRNILLIQSP